MTYYHAKEFAESFTYLTKGGWKPSLKLMDGVWLPAWTKGHATIFKQEGGKFGCEILTYGNRATSSGFLDPLTAHEVAERRLIRQGIG